MVRRFAMLIGALSISLVSFCAQPLPAFPQVLPSIFIQSATATANGSMASGDIAGASVCRFNLSGLWSAIVKANVLSTGSSTAVNVPLFNDTNVEFAGGTAADGDYVFYPQGAGTVSLVVSSYVSGTVAENGINCAPAAVGHPNTDSTGSQYVAFNTSQPITIITGSSPIPVTTPPPTTAVALTVGATPLPVTTPPPTTTVAVSSLAIGATPLPVSTPPPTTSVAITVGATPFPVTTPPPTTSVGVSSLGSIVISGTTLPIGGTVGVSSVAGTVTTAGTTTATIAVGATPLPVTTAAPITSISVSNASSFPTPIPTTAPVPAPTASAGATPPTNAQWGLSLGNCIYNGLQTNSQATPAPTSGNVLPCQADPNGAEQVAPPALYAKAIVASNGTYLSTLLNGENTCKLIITSPISGTGTVNVYDELIQSFAGPFFAISGSSNTVTFNLVTPAYATLNSLSIGVTSLGGTGGLTLQLRCSSALGVVSANQNGAPWSFNTPYTVASPLPVTTPVPFHSYPGSILTAVPSDTGGTAYTAASPMPVTTPPPTTSLSITNTLPTPIPYTSASPMPVAFPTPFALSYTVASPEPISTPSAIPLPTASAGAAASASAPLVDAQMMCFFASGQTSITATNVYAAKCDKVGNLSTSAAGHSNVIASAAVATCTAVATGPEILTDVIYANATAQTGTLEIFNEGASPTCAAGDLIYVSVNHPIQAIPDVVNHLAMAGIAYEWLTNPQAAGGKVLIDMNP